MRGWCAQRGMSVHITCRFQIHRQRDCLARTHVLISLHGRIHHIPAAPRSLPKHHRKPCPKPVQTCSNLLTRASRAPQIRPNSPEIQLRKGAQWNGMQRFSRGLRPAQRPPVAHGERLGRASTKGRKAPHVPRHSADRRLARPRYGASRRPIPGRRRMLRVPGPPRRWRVRAQREKMRFTIGGRLL